MKDTIATSIASLARFLDSQGKPDATIHAYGARAYLRRDFKPKKRGGSLYCGEHPIDLMPAPLRDPNTVEMFTDEGRATAEARA